MNRKILKVSMILFCGVLATLLFITLNLYSVHYHGDSAYAQGITTPTVSQSTTQQSGSQPTIAFDTTLIAGIIGAVGTILGAVVSAILAIFLDKENLFARHEATNRRKRRLKKSELLRLWDGLYNSIKDTEIVELDTHLPINDVYIPSKVVQKFSSTLSFSLHSNVPYPDITKLIQEKQAGHQNLFNNAKDLCDVFLPDDRPWCLLAGDVGVGKTLQLKHYVLEHIYPQDWSLSTDPKGSQRGNAMDLSDWKLPIYIELKEFAEQTLENKELSLIDFIVRKWERSFDLKGLVEQYIEDKLNKGEAIFLLDGLDEAFLGSKPLETYRIVLQAIKDQGTRHTNVPMIVTTRDSHYQRYKDGGHYLTGFPKWELLGFRITDIETYITKWSQCRALGLVQVDAEGIHRNLAQSLRIQSLATHPLLLIHIITRPQYTDWKKPDQRVSIYRESAEMFLRKGDSRRHNNPVLSLAGAGDSPLPTVPNRGSWEIKLAILEKLGWLLHNSGTYYLREDDVLKHLVQMDTAGTTRDTFALNLQEIVEDGLLKKDEGLYCFFCLPLQEYFAARNAKNAGTDLRRYGRDARHRNNLWWEEVISVYDKLR